MRTMIGKRIGPVPISLVAVLALAAFISAGLWLVPNGQSAEAQAGVTSPGSMTVDVGEAFSAPITTWWSDLPADVTTSQLAAYLPDSEDDADTNPEPLTGSTIGLAGTPAVLTFSMTADQISAALGADVVTGELKITIGYDAPSAGTPAVDPDEVFSGAFTLTVLQNPTEDGGELFENPILAPEATVLSAWPVTDDRDTADVNEAACEVVTVGTARRSRGMQLREDAAETAGDAEDAGTTNEFLVSGGDCTTSGDSVDVMITSEPVDGTTETTETRYLVYETGGNGYTDVKPVVAKAGLTKHLITLEGTGGSDSPSVDYVDQSITVDKAMSDDMGVVYLFGYTITDTNTSDGLLAKNATTFADDPDFVVKVQFLEAVDAGESTVEAPESIADDTTTAEIKVTVNDSNGNPVGGVNVDFDLIDAPSTVLFDNNRQRQLGTSGPDGQESAMVKGLHATDPMRVQVQVSIGTGDDAITKMVNLVREGDPASVSISTYAEMPITRAESIDDEDKESSFFVRAAAQDSAMNHLDQVDANVAVVGSDEASAAAITVSNIGIGPQSPFNAAPIVDEGVAEWWDTLNCMQMNDAVYPGDGDPAVGPDDATSPYCAMYADLEDDARGVVNRAAGNWFKVKINDGADAGSYSV